MRTLHEQSAASRETRGQQWRTMLRSTGFIIALVVVVFPLITGDVFLISIGTNTLINATLALSLTLVYGMGGMISLAQVGFGAVAAYCVVLGVQNGYSFSLALILAVVATAALATVLGLPVVRMSGISLLTATFAFTEIFRLVALNWTSVTGGETGRVVEYKGLTRLPGASFLVSFLPAAAADYLVAILLLLVAAGVVWCYRQSRSGRNLMSLRDNESLATALGIQALRERLGAFVLGSIIAAVGGVYLAYYNGIVDPTTMEIGRSIDLVIIILVGGIYSIRGAVVGAIVVTVIPEFLQVAMVYRPILYGVLLIIFATRLRLGIVGELQRIIRARGWGWSRDGQYTQGPGNDS